MTPLIIERVYHAPIDRVWKALTRNEDMKHWYFKLEDFKPVVGFEFSFTGGKDGREYVHRCKITEVIEGKKIAYSWQYEGYKGYSVVTFELSPEGTDTRLRLTHEGLDSFPTENPDFDTSSFNEGWTHITGIALKKFVEGT